jgi:hypothetical protein
MTSLFRTDGGTPRRRTRIRTRRAVGIATVGVSCLATWAAAAPASAAPVAAAAGNSHGSNDYAYTVNVNLNWSRTFCAAGQTCGFTQSSPTSASLDGQSDILIGSTNGDVYAVHQSNGSDVGGWPVATGHPILSSPSVDPTNNEVFIGAGDDRTSGGGYYSFSANGQTRFAFQPEDHTGTPVAVASTPAVGDVNSDGIADVTATTLGLEGWSLSERQPGRSHQQPGRGASGGQRGGGGAVDPHLQRHGRLVPQRGRRRGKPRDRHGGGRLLVENRQDPFLRLLQGLRVQHRRRCGAIVGHRRLHQQLAHLGRCDRQRHG